MAAARERLSSRWFAVVVYVVNVAAIVSAIASGHRKGDLALRFQEKQSITFLSANQLAMTAVVALAIWLVHRHALGRRGWFWLLSSIGFLFLMLDEGFQFHEGMDSRLFEMIGSGEKNPRVDGLSTALYGLGAFAVCWVFRDDILRYRPTVGFFCAGGFFLAATSALNFGDAPAWQVVLEESCKLLGVCSFLLGFLAALFGTLAELRDRIAAGAAATGPPARAPEPSTLHAP